MLALTGAVCLLMVAATVYFLPGLIAADRRHRNRYAIFALNLLLGWTFLGWVAALVWSLTDNTQPEAAR